MSVPSKKMAKRLEIASHLTRYSLLLEKLFGCQTSQIRKAINLLKDKNYAFKFSGKVDNNYWGYKINGLVIKLPVPKRHVCPPIHGFEILIDVDILSNLNNWKSMSDPFIKQNFRVIARGVDINSTYSFGYHIDRHDPSQVTHEVHPAYHLQIITRGNGITDTGNILSLDVPRFVHLPVDLILGIDIAISNFAPDYWEKLKKERDYIRLVTDYQNFVWKPYIHSIASKWPYTKNNINWTNSSEIIPNLMS
jgi:hypothetical protein